MRNRLLVVLPFMLAACATPALDPITALQKAAKSTVVDLSDGVSEVEAYKIASEVHPIGCGCFGVPVDGEKEWRVAAYEGLAPMHTCDIMVDKKTGACRVVLAFASRPGQAPNHSPEPTPGAVH